MFYGAAKAWVDLGKEPRILMQRGRKYKRAEEFARGIACHVRAKAFAIRIPALFVSRWRINRLAHP